MNWNCNQQNCKDSVLGFKSGVSDGREVVASNMGSTQPNPIALAELEAKLRSKPESPVKRATQSRECEM